MQLFGKDLNSEVAIIAEIGVNHEGDVEKASQLLHADQKQQIRARV